MTPPRHHHNADEDDDSTQELPPVITEKARVSLSLAVLIPAGITLGGAIIWTTKFYLGQLETQTQVAKIATTLEEMQHDQNELKYQARQIQAELARIRASLNPPLSGLSKSTPTYTALDPLK